MIPGVFSGSQTYDRRGVPTGGRDSVEEYPGPHDRDQVNPPVRRYVIYVGKDRGSLPYTRFAFDVAHYLQDHAPQIDGSVNPAIGFGAWGVEPSVKIVTTNNLPVRVMGRVVEGLLETFGMECAYVEHDGQAWEWTVNGERSPIEGFRGGEGE